MEHENKKSKKIKITRVILISMIICFFCFLAILTIIREFSTPVMIFFYSALLLSIIFIAIKFISILPIMNKRKTLWGINASIYTLIIISIVIIINIIGFKYKYVKDMTEEKIFTLSEQTNKILDSLNSPMKITAFYTDANEAKLYVKELLEQYKHRSNNVSYEFIDPDSNPAKARFFNISKDGSTVFQYKDKNIEITGTNEQAITTGMIKVLSGNQKKIAYISGHGEPPLKEGAKRSCSKLLNYLKNDNFNIEEVVLAKGRQDLKNFDLVLIVGPTQKYEDKELEIIDQFSKNCGNLILLLDPYPSFDFSDLLTSWNLRIGDDFVIDIGSPYWSDTTSPLVDRYPENKITRDLSLSFYPYSRSISVIDPKNMNVKIEPLVKTSENSWAEKSRDVIKFDENIDTKGPIDIAYVAVKEIDNSEKSKESGKSSKQSKLIVFGDSDFVIDHFIDSLANKDMIMNCVNYLTGQDNLISIRPKEFKKRDINFTSFQFMIIKIITIFLIPLLFTVNAIIIWYKKR
jgi:ABC-type uncharacterized transport system involved in gliding motility auxiliary subunit